MDEDENFQMFLDMLKHMQEQERIQIINPKRMKEMKDAYKALSKVILDMSPDAKIDCQMGELNDGSGVIRIETDEIVATNVKEFIKGIVYADNFEIYPLKNGNIKIAVMFYGVMKEL